MYLGHSMNLKGNLNGVLGMVARFSLRFPWFWVFQIGCLCCCGCEFWFGVSSTLVWYYGSDMMFNLLWWWWWWWLL